MRDLTYSASLDNDNGIASGTVTVKDFNELIGASATGTITVVDWAIMEGKSATGTITIGDYQELDEVTVTVGGEALVEGVDWTAGTANSNTATSLASAINGIDGISAAAEAAIITITAAEGYAGNNVTLSTDAEEGITLSASKLSGGQEPAVVTVGESELVEGVDFTAGTANSNTATSLAIAIDGEEGYSATADGAVVTITADVGSAGNVEVVVSAGMEATDLTGGVDEGVISFGAVDFVQGTDFTAETSNDATATSIASAFDGEEGFSASADDNVVTITADTQGPEGNALISTNKPDGVIVSGVDGGADEFYTPVFDYSNQAYSAITVEITLDDLTGESKDLDAQIQLSTDKVTWHDSDLLNFSDDGMQITTITKPLSYARVQFTIVGTGSVKVRMQTSDALIGTNETINIIDVTPDA